MGRKNSQSGARGSSKKIRNQTANDAEAFGEFGESAESAVEEFKEFGESAERAAEAFGEFGELVERVAEAYEEFREFAGSAIPEPDGNERIKTETNG